MSQISLYVYEIPLEETGGGKQPTYDYPEKEVLTQFERGDKMVVVHEQVIPNLHRDNVAVDVEIVPHDEAPLPD